MTLAANSRHLCAIAALCLIGLATSLHAQNPGRSTKPKLSSANPLPQSVQSQQENFSFELMQQLQAIQTAALSDEYAYQQLAHLTENIGARAGGSAGAKAAVAYVAAQMRDLGLDVHLEEVKVRHWVRGVETAALVEYPGIVPGTRQKIIVTALGGSTSTGADGITVDLVVVNDFAHLRALGHDKVAGKIVLFNEKFDKRKAEAGLAVTSYREGVGYRETGPAAAAELGAVAALVRSIGSADYRLPHTGDSDPAGIPAGAVSAEDAELIAHLAAEGPVRMHLTLTPQKLPDETSYNVIGDLQGSQHPEQVVIVSGHLDSWDLGTGALDDGAGVVMAMETAHLLQHLGLRPKRTLRVIAWMDEETDGAGIAQYRKDNRSDFNNHVAAIESDVGAAHPLGFVAKMSKAAAEALKPVQTVLSSIGATVFQETSQPPGITDIAPMSEEGVPLLGILQDMRKYYDYHHTAADTLDKVVPSELRENAAAMAVMAYALADMKDPLPR
jgi:Zn-dependent M28 family amino/carboxypeptidase